MTSPVDFATALIYLLWTWKVFSFIYSSYAVSDKVTPTNAGPTIKATLTAMLVLTSMIVHLMPVQDYPRLSFFQRIMGLPSQIHSMYVMHWYVGPTLDSRRFTIFLYIVSILSALETMYMLHVDWSRID